MPNNIGAFGENFPYSNQHDMNMDWVIKIAKDFLDKYSHLEETLEQGIQNLQDTTTEGQTTLQNEATTQIGNLTTKYNEIVGLLNTWYTTHSNDIANELTTAISNFETQAQAIGLEVIDSIPSDYTALNDEVDNVRASVNMAVDTKDVIKSSDLVAGYYSTVDGSKQTGQTGNYKMIPNLVRADENTVYVSNTAQNTRIACFDKTMTYISSIWALTRSFREKRDFTPSGTYYVGLHSESATTIEIQKIDSSKEQMIEYPFNGNYIYQENTWMNGYGTIEAVDTLSMIVLANLKAGDKYFCNNNATVGMVFLDNSYNVVEATRTQSGVNGWIYTVPSNAHIAYCNIYNSHLTKVGGVKSGYIAKITKQEKILCIGDSYTWLDGRENWGGMQVFSGWQRQLRGEGYEVVNAAWSGYPYADELDESGGVYYSLYTEIVTNQYDVSGYDYIILFGGANDVLYNGALGERTSNYDTRTFDETTFNGALSAIISYIRTNNSTSKLLLMTFPKSEALSRTFTNANSRVEEIKYNSLFWSCKLVDVFTDMNISPSYDNFDEYFYDVTHPNFYGMQRIGKLVIDTIKNYF